MRDRRRSRLVLVLLLLTSLTLITLDYRGGESSPLGSLRSAASAVVGPLERAANAIADPVAGFVDDIGSFGDSEQTIRDLEAENERLRRELRAAALAQARSDDYARLLGLAGAGQYRVVPAKVIALGDALGFEHTATIDAGRDDGIRVGMTVVSGDGLVGRVKSIAARTSTVLLASDAISSVGARIESTGNIGFVTGQGRRHLSFELLDPNAKVTEGQRLVTFGSPGGRPFVAEVPIGVITEVENAPGRLTRRASVDPYVDFGALDVVAVVIAAPARIPRDSVLPPKPTARPRPAPATSATPGVAPTPTPSPTRRP